MNIFWVEIKVPLSYNWYRKQVENDMDELRKELNVVVEEKRHE